MAHFWQYDILRCGVVRPYFPHLRNGHDLDCISDFHRGGRPGYMARDSLLWYPPDYSEGSIIRSVGAW